MSRLVRCIDVFLAVVLFSIKIFFLLCIIAVCVSYAVTSNPPG